MVVVNKFIFSNILVCKINLLHKKKDYNTWTSQVVTHPSITQAQPCLTLEIRRDPVCSQWYGRRQIVVHFERLNSYIGFIFSSWCIDLKFIKPGVKKISRNPGHGGFFVQRNFVFPTFTLLRKNSIIIAKR